MSRYQITSSASVDMGTYEADAAEVAGSFTGTVIEVTAPTLCDYETGETIREAAERESREL